MSETRQIQVNGEVRRVRSGSVCELLRELGHDPSLPGVAVALNGEVVHRARWPETTVREGDQVEVVTAVQGG